MIVDLYSTREAWLAGRGDPTAIGASEVAACLGVHPQLDAWTLYDRKVNGVRVANDSPVLARGNRWEGVVLGEYADASGNVLVEPGAHFGKPGALVTLANEAFPWLRSSPDSFAREGGTLGHVEAKTSMHRDGWSPDHGIVIERWTDNCADLLPSHYAVQAYAQLAVSELPWNDVCALVPDGGWLAVRYVRVMADPETQAAIVEEVGAWRERHLVAKEPPPIDGTTACNRWLARTTKKRADARPVTEAERADIERYAALCAEKKKREVEMKELANRLVLASDGMRLTTGGKGAPFGQPQYAQGKTTVDAKRLKDEFPQAHAACLRKGQPTVSFRLYGFSNEEESDDDQ